MASSPRSKPSGRAKARAVAKKGVAKARTPPRDAKGLVKTLRPKTDLVSRRVTKAAAGKAVSGAGKLKAVFAAGKGKAASAAGKLKAASAAGTRAKPKAAPPRAAIRKAAPAPIAARKQPAARDTLLKKPSLPKSAAVPVRASKVRAVTPKPASARAGPAPKPAPASPVWRPAVRRPAAKDSRPADPVKPDKEALRAHGTLTLQRAFDLLETLARTGPLALQALADAAGFGKTAASDILATLRARHFVLQDEAHGVWRLGARWSVVGQAASGQGALAAAALPYLAALGAATGENVYLRVRDGLEAETVAVHQTDPALRVYTEAGTKMPLHAGTGRLLLAHAPESVQTQVLTQRLQRYTPSTRIDPKWIAADLHRIRQRGFLITDSEVIPGTVTVCAPVRDASGQVVAALLIGAPSLRMRPPRPRALMPAVVEAAHKLSQALGAVVEPPAAPRPVNGQEHRPGQASGQAPGHAPGQAQIISPAWPTAAPAGAVSKLAAPTAAPTAAVGAGIARPHSIFR